MRLLRPGAATLVAVLLTAGCGAAATDRSGGRTTVLRFASIDVVNDNGQSYAPQAFVDALAQVSGGRLTASVVTDFGHGAATAETDLVREIAAGRVDGGWPATRAFARAGLTGLQAVEAPLTITSYAAEKEVASGPLARRLLATLDGSGVVGLGLAVGPLRRPFAAQTPLLGPHDWTGARFRVFNSPVQAATVSALGGTPVDASFDWVDRITEGSLRGGEGDLAGYAYLGLAPDVGTFTGDVVLWPKMLVLSISRTRFAALDAQQQGWVRAAARAAVTASTTAGYNDQVPADRLCARGTPVVTAGPGRVAALQAGVRPVLAALAADRVSGPLLHDLQAVAAGHRADVVRPGAGCPAASTGPGPAPDERSALPDGTYRTQISPADVTAAGYGNGPGLSGTWTLTVAAGRYTLTCDASRNPTADCGQETTKLPLEAGDLRGAGRTVWFVYDPQRLASLTGCRLPPSQTEPGHCWDGRPYRMDWRLNGDRLTFGGFVGAPGFTDDQWLVKPWTRIA